MASAKVDSDSLHWKKIGRDSKHFRKEKKKRNGERTT